METSGPELMVEECGITCDEDGPVLETELEKSSTQWATICPGAPVFARWRNTNYYSGRVTGKGQYDTWNIAFDDGMKCNVSEAHILPILVLGVGFRVFYYSSNEIDKAIIAQVIGQKKTFVSCGLAHEVETINYAISFGQRLKPIWCTRDRLFLTEVVAKTHSAVFQSVLPKPAVGDDISSNNIVSGRRRQIIRRFDRSRNKSESTVTQNLDSRLKLQKSEACSLFKATTLVSESGHDFSKDVIIEACKSLQDNSFNLPEPRDKTARMEESQGIISCHVIAHLLSGTPRQILIWLIELKELIFHLIPKISREYITRVVMHPEQKNLVIIKNNHPIAGISFRIFSEPRISEIVFCVVKPEEQVRGYGTHLMNQMKDYHTGLGIYNLFTFADKQAIGYFRKQGFTTDIFVPKSMYEGYIKTYSGASLMHCELMSGIQYTKLGAVIQRQSEVVRHIVNTNIFAKDEILKVSQSLS